MEGVDYALFLFINKRASHVALDPYFMVLTDGRFLTALFLSLMIAYLLLSKNRREALILTGGALLLFAVCDAGVHYLVKPFFGRLRPCNPSYFVDGVHQFLEGGRFLCGHKSSLSFPSIHALVAFAQALYWGKIFPKVLLPMLLLAIAIAYSRVYVGVHYPSDVVAGAVVGTLLGWGASHGMQKSPWVQRLNALK